LRKTADLLVKAPIVAGVDALLDILTVESRQA
jgi:hypothetical protein